MYFAAKVEEIINLKVPSDVLQNKKQYHTSFYVLWINFIIFKATIVLHSETASSEATSHLCVM